MGDGGGDERTRPDWRGDEQGDERTQPATSSDPDEGLDERLDEGPADGAAGPDGERRTAKSFPRAPHRRPGRGCLRPPPSGFTMLPWLLLGMGSVSHLVQGKANPIVAGVGLLVFNSLYISVVFRALVERKRDTPLTWATLAVMGLLTFGLAAWYGGGWLMFFPLYGLACGAVLRGRALGVTVGVLTLVAGGVGGWRGGWDGLTIAYVTLVSGLITATLLTLSRTVVELRETRQELARTAVDKERLRFSRDLHDLLGHTLSVIVVKSEAARRLAHRDLDAALHQVDDIECVGRQALAEIREAVTGYREGSLATELERARDALESAGIETLVRQSGPPLPPGTAALLGWVVRECATNAVRHSGAAHCEFAIDSTAERVRLLVTDDGPGSGGDRSGSGFGGAQPGSGLKGLGERVTSAGGSLEAGPAPGRGFRVVAELPVRETPVASPAGR
ncbi:sensor histidine kinase [Streptomyces sp. NA04227]|nr:sensor histidine kinase [Streptomyces sp. NA04227]